MPTNRPKILYVVHRVPYPPNKGDRIRTFHLLKFLSDRCDVHLACLADEPVDESTVKALQRYCERLSIVQLGSVSRWARAASWFLRGRTASEGAFYSRLLANVLSAWAHEVRYDGVVASASSVARYLRLPRLSDVPAIVDLIDVDSQKWFDYADDSSGPRAWFYRREGSRLRRLERSIADWASAITLVSQAEVDVYRTFCRDGSVHAVPNGVDLDYFLPVHGNEHPHPYGRHSLSSWDYPSPRSCVFVGALDYRPNVDGVCWFCERVWPQLSDNFIDGRFFVVGRNPTAAVRRCGSIPGVEVVGPVADVRPYVAWAPVAVAPLWIARGIQNKVLEAMAMARAVVASPDALSGLKAQPGRHLLKATSPQEWVDTIGWLWNDPTLAAAYGASARHHVEENHRWDRCLEPFASLLQLYPTSPSLAAPNATPNRTRVPA